MRAIDVARRWLSDLRLRWLVCLWIVGAVAVSVLRNINTHGDVGWLSAVEVPLSVALVVIAIWWIILHRNRILDRLGHPRQEKP